MASPVVPREPGGRRRRAEPGLVQRLALIPITGQIPRLLFRTLPSRLCRPLDTIVPESVIWQGHVFLGFSKCGRFLLSYTRRFEEIDETATALYVYHLHWWGYSLSRPLQQVCCVRLFGDTPACSDLILNVCEWPSDNSQIVVYGISAVISELPLDLLPSEEHRDVFITIAASPPLTACAECSRALPTGESGLSGRCTRHGYLVSFHYQVVSPFPTFRPSIQLFFDRILVLNRSYSLLACAVSLTEDTASATPGLLYQQAETRTETQGLGSPGRQVPTSSEDSGMELRGTSYNCSIYSLTHAPSQEHLPGGRGSSSYDDDTKPDLPVSVTSFALRQSIPISEARAQRAMCIRVEQLTLDLEDVIITSITSHAPWSDRFCCLTDYDAIVLQVCPSTASVLLVIGLIVLAFPVAPKSGIDRCPRAHHSSVFIRWSLSTGRAETIGVEELLHDVGGKPNSVCR